METLTQEMQEAIKADLNKLVGAIRKVGEWTGKEADLSKTLAYDLDAVDPSWANFKYTNIKDLDGLKRAADKQDNPEAYIVTYGVLERIREAAPDGTERQKVQNVRRWGIAYQGSKALNPDNPKKAEQAKAAEAKKAERAAKSDPSKTDGEIDLTVLAGHKEVLNTLLVAANQNLDHCGWDDESLHDQWLAYRDKLAALIATISK